MQTVFSQRLLAGLRAVHGDEEVRDDDTFQDPHDSGPQLSVTLKRSPVDEIYALPVAQPEQTSGRCPDIGDQSKGPQSAADPPAAPDLLDPAVLRTMPAGVAAFMMYEPPQPSAWRRQETLSERAHREMIEDCGSWVGD
jgi:hypothetical protein